MWFLIGFLLIRVTFHFYHKNNAFNNAHDTRDCELSNCGKSYTTWARDCDLVYELEPPEHRGETKDPLSLLPELPFMPKALFLLPISHIVRVLHSCFYLQFYYDSTIFFWLNHNSSSWKCLILTWFIHLICLRLMNNIHPFGSCLTLIRTF